MNSISWNLLYAVKTLYFPSTSSEKFSAVREEKPAWHMMWKLPSQMAEAKQKHFLGGGGFSEWRISGIYPSAQPRQ